MSQGDTKYINVNKAKIRICRKTELSKIPSSYFLTRKFSLFSDSFLFSVIVETYASIDACLATVDLFLLQLIYLRERQSALYDAFQIVMYPQQDADKAECYKSRFYSYALFGLLDEWIQRGFNETPEEMVGITESIRIVNES